MNALQNIDFKYPSKDVLFELCMSEIKVQTRNEVLERFGLDHLKTEEEPSKEFNIDELKEIVGEYKLLPYSELLFGYQKRWFIQRDSISKRKKSLEDDFNEDLNYKFRIAKALKIFFEDDPNKKRRLILSFPASKEKIEFNGNTELYQLLDLFLYEFERLKLNETELTKEEAIRELEQLEDIDWINENTDGEFFDGYRVKSELIPDELLEDYMFVHYKPREVTFKIVNRVINELEDLIDQRKQGVGAPARNLRLGELAKRLSYLHRIDSFLNKSQYASIKNLPLPNKTCRFIYDYFEYWDLLYDHVKFDATEKEKRANYIKALIKANLKFSEKGHNIINTALESRIDLFKSVKNGRTSPEQFYEMLSDS